MEQPTPRIYVDTSVFGGVFDPEFERASRELFDQIAEGRFRIVTSAVVEGEVSPAPERVRELFDAVLPLAEVVPLTTAVRELAAAFLAAGILDESSEIDALHDALATVHGCAVLVSWDFRHLVNYWRIPRFLAVMAERGYQPIGIHSPLELIQYDDEES